MKKNNSSKPVRPIYIFGAVCLAYSLLFSISGFWGLIKCVCLAGIIAGIFGKPKKNKQSDSEQPKQKPRQDYQYTYTPRPNPQVRPEAQPEPQSQPESQPVREMDEVVEQGRRYVARIQQLNDDIPDYKISAQLKQIEILTASIIDQVESHKEKKKEIRQFMNYYLPTTIKLLEQYVQMQNVGLQGENISAGMQQIEDMLDKVIVAFQKQLDNLFERDIVDITADIQVMEQMMKAQGLTQETDF